MYRYALEKASILLSEIYKIISIRPLLILPWICCLVLIGYIVGLMVKHEPMIGGSGIPQVEGVSLRKLDMKWWRIIVAKFIGGVLTIGSGLSLGREGPSVQLGAAVGQGFSRLLKRIKIEEKYLITCGASAGLAAALSAAFVSSCFFGLKPVLDFENLSPLPLKYYLYIILLGIVVGLLGVVFNKLLLKTQNLYTNQKWLPKEMRIIVPLLISIIFGILLPQVLGGGHELIISLFKGNFSLTLLVIIIAMKFLFTMVSYGSGAPGGIFLPLLAIGALIGNVYGIVLIHFVHFNSMYINNFIILAMAGYFKHLLPLAIVSIVAYMVADLLSSKPIYESLLQKFLHNLGDTISIGNRKNKSILEFAVCMGSSLDNKQIKDVKWPSHCLLVSVKRGEHEIIPKGDTVIYPGDYLIVLTNENWVSTINDSLNTMIVSNETLS